MQRKPVNSEVPPELVRERLVLLMDSSLPVEDKLRHLAVLRAATAPEDIDRALGERMGQLHDGLRSAQARQEEFR